MRRKTLVTGVLFLVLLAALWLLNQKREERRAADESAQQMFHFEPGKVNRLTMIYPNQAIICQRTSEGTWEMVQPIQGLADDGAIGEIISGLRGLRIERVVAEEKDLGSGEQLLSEYGLTQPGFAVHLGLEKGELDTLVVGEKSPTTAYTFAARTSELKALLVLSSSVEAIQKSLYDLRDKHLLDFDPPDAIGLEIKYEDQRVVCSKSEGKWRLTYPIETLADPAQIDSLLRTMKQSLATRFVAEKVPDLTRLGLDHPTLEVTLAVSEDTLPLSLLIGSKIQVQIKKEGEEDRITDEYFAKDTSRDPIFMVTTELVDALRKTPFDLRDRAVLVFEKPAVDRLELAREGLLIVCVKDSAATWQMTAPMASKAKDWRVNGLLADLESLKAEDFVSERPKALAPFGLDRPRIEVRLLKGKTLVAELWIGDRKDSQVYVKAKDRGWVYLVQDDILDELEVDVDDIADTVGGKAVEPDVI
jgi:hypothetical protein